MDVTFTSVDLMVLLAVAHRPDESGADCDAILAAGETLDCRLTSPAGLMRGLARLTAAGLITEGPMRYYPTPDGRALVAIEPTEESLSEAWVRLQARFDGPRIAAPAPTAEPQAWQRPDESEAGAGD